jgi:hypothetical protein
METNTPVKTYYIKASVICSDAFEEIFWARMCTDEIEDVISIANTIYGKMFDERPRMSSKPRLIIDLVSDYDPDQGVSFHQHLYKKTYSGKVTVKDLDYDMKKIRVSLSQIKSLCCYRDDLDIPEDFFSSENDDLKIEY